MKNNTKASEHLITKDDISSLIANSRNGRDKVLFSASYDSGWTLGEIINMRIQDLSFYEFGAVLKATDKNLIRASQNSRQFNRIPEGMVRQSSSKK
jgi:site-specific recombinase XerD